MSQAPERGDHCVGAARVDQFTTRLHSARRSPAIPGLPARHDSETSEQIAQDITGGQTPGKGYGKEQQPAAKTESRQFARAVTQVPKEEMLAAIEAEKKSKTVKRSGRRNKSSTRHRFHYRPYRSHRCILRLNSYSIGYAIQTS